MPDEYLTDDEQLEVVKRWTAENGPWLVGGLVIGLAGLFGYRYYERHQDERALHAAAQFDDMASALQHNDRKKTEQIAGGLIRDYPSSPYADQAKLTLARLNVDEGQDANAVSLLSQVMDTSKDTELKHVARLRLARVLIDQGKPDDALKLLTDAPGAFQALYHEVRGDAFYAKKDLRQAVTEYKEALGEGASSAAESGLLTLKIADLGLPAAPMVPTPAATPTPAAPSPAPASAAPPAPASAAPPPAASGAPSTSVDSSNKAKH
jgi:predicted negative regulator of RcsB-dependent stress response